MQELFGGQQALTAAASMAYEGRVYFQTNERANLTPQVGVRPEVPAHVTAPMKCVPNEMHDSS
jgi:hypothetical protein